MQGEIDGNRIAFLAHRHRRFAGSIWSTLPGTFKAFAAEA
jgi:hypothetical protein